jgi:hypothetical protein
MKFVLLPCEQCDRKKEVEDSMWRVIGIVIDLYSRIRTLEEDNEKLKSELAGDLADKHL